MSLTVTPISDDECLWRVVQHNGRAWTVSKLHSANMVGWSVANESGRQIDPSKPLGQKLIAAIRKHQETT